MNEWSKESLEEMFGDNVIEQLTFLSGCTKHSYCDPSHTDLNGYIVSHEKLEKFAELIVREFTNICYNHPAKIKSNNWTATIVPDDIANRIKEHFGVE